MLSRAFRSRFLELNVEELPDTELSTILERRCAARLLLLSLWPANLADPGGVKYKIDIPQIEWKLIWEKVPLA